MRLTRIAALLVLLLLASGMPRIVASADAPTMAVESDRIVLTVAAGAVGLARGPTSALVVGAPSAATTDPPSHTRRENT